MGESVTRRGVNVVGWVGPLVIFAVSMGLAIVSLAIAPGITIIGVHQFSQFSTPAFNMAMMAMAVPAVIFTYRYPRTSVLSLAAVVGPVWYLAATEAAHHDDVVEGGDPLWSAWPFFAGGQTFVIVIIWLLAIVVRYRSDLPSRG